MSGGLEARLERLERHLDQIEVKLRGLITDEARMARSRMDSLERQLEATRDVSDRVSGIEQRLREIEDNFDTQVTETMLKLLDVSKKADSDDRPTQPKVQTIIRSDPDLDRRLERIESEERRKQQDVDELTDDVLKGYTPGEM